MRALILSTILALAAGLAQAQAGYPAKPIRLIYPYPAGGTGDSVMRVVADMLGPELGGTVLVDNRPGASGVVGTRMVAESPPDGYTLGLASNGTHAAVVSLVKNPGYDPIRSFTYLGKFVSLPWMLVVANDVPAKSVSELVALARAQPGKLAISHYSSSSRLLVHQLQSSARVKLTEVPYKAPGQIINDLYGGQLQVAFFPMEIAMAQAQSGKLRVIGAAAEKRFATAPNIPAINEQVPGVALTSWMGLSGPAGLPPELAARLSSALSRVVAKPEFRERIEKLSCDVLTTGPQETVEQIRGEMTLWSNFAKEAGIQPE